VGFMYQSACVIYFCVYMFMEIPLYCFFWEEVLWKFLNSVFPSESSSSRLNWKASPLRLYIPAGSSSCGRILYFSCSCISVSTYDVNVNVKPSKCLPHGMHGGWLLHSESYACTSD